MLISMSGCSCPSTLFLVSTTRTSSSSACLFHLLDTCTWTMLINVSGCARAPSFSSASLATPAALPPSTLLDSSRLLLGYTCWSACPSVPASAPSFSSPPFSIPVPLLPSTVADSSRLLLSYTCWSAFLPRHPLSRFYHSHLHPPSFHRP